MQDLLNDSQVQDQLAFWNGTLTDAKEMSRLIPVAKDVKLEISDVEIYSEKDGEERPWKMLKITFKVADGIEVAGETKYRGTLLTEMFVYFANPAKYDMDKPFYKSGSFLVPIKQLVIATESASPKLVLGGITDESARELAENLKGKMILGSILQVKETTKDLETGKYVPTGELKNEVKNFKKAPDSSLI